jgi:hypothetical protein
LTHDLIVMPGLVPSPMFSCGNFFPAATSFLRQCQLSAPPDGFAIADNMLV